MGVHTFQELAKDAKAVYHVKLIPKIFEYNKSTKREFSSWRQDTKHKVFASVDWQRKNFAFTLKHRG